MVSEVQLPDGRRIAFQQFGNPGGRPVFSLHGTPGSRVGPHPTQMRLYPQGVRIIAYDRPGYGDSTIHPGRVVADAAADVEAVADALGLERFAVVGRSGGGPHALACAALLPERVTRVAVLASCAPKDLMGDRWYDGMAEDNAKLYHVAELGRDHYAEHVAPELNRRRADPESILPHNHSELPEKDRPRALDHGVKVKLVDTFTEALKCGVGGWIDDTIAFVSPWGFELPRGSRDLLLWHGAEDTLSPIGHFDCLRARMPGAQFDLVRAEAHLSALQAYPRLLTWLITDTDWTGAARWAVL